MAHLESNVPQEIQNLLNDLLDLRRHFPRFAVMQEHHVNVAERIEFLAAVSAERDQRERAFCVGAFLLGDRGGGRKYVLQQHIDKIDSPGANLPSTSSGLMLQPQPVFFDGQEFLVERENFSRPTRAGQRQLIFSMSQNLF